MLVPAQAPVEAIGDGLVPLPLSDTFITERHITGPRARPMLKRSYETVRVSHLGCGVVVAVSMTADRPSRQEQRWHASGC